MRTFLEKGYGWPLFVIVLLVSSVAMMGIVVMAARSDGGAQVIDDYYEKAVQWDSLAASRTAAATLGWTTDLSLIRNEAGLTGMITLQDADGMPVTEYDITVSLRRPQLAAEIANLTAQPGSEPGSYGFQISSSDRGLWDVQAQLQPTRADAVPLLFEWRREVR